MEEKRRRTIAACRVAASVFAILVIICFAFINPEAETMDVVGMLAAVAALSVVLWWFPLPIYLLPLGFTLLAAAGSIVGLYARFFFYDKIVHGISGVMLAYIGYFLAGVLLRRLRLPDSRALRLVMAFLFAGMCAGMWEIFEFTADQLLAMEVQHGNADTMGDIIAGFVGGALYCLAAGLAGRLRGKKTPAETAQPRA